MVRVTFVSGEVVDYPTASQCMESGGMKVIDEKIEGGGMRIVAMLPSEEVASTEVNP